MYLGLLFSDMRLSADRTDKSRENKIQIFKLICQNAVHVVRQYLRQKFKYTYLGLLFSDMRLSADRTDNKVLREQDTNI
jgi:hypothetical protein